MGRDTLIELRIPKHLWMCADPIRLGIYWKLAEMGLTVKSASHSKTRRTERTKFVLDMKANK